MPLYKLLDNLVVTDAEGEQTTRRRGAYMGLFELSEQSREDLVTKGKIRALETPEWTYFEALAEYDIIMEELGVESLGDFAGLNPADLPPELVALQEQALDILNPETPSTLENCCGESQTSIPYAT